MTNDQRTRALERQAQAQAQATGRAPHDDPAHLRRLWRQGQRRSGERSCARCEGEGSSQRLASGDRAHLYRTSAPCPDCNGTGRAPLAWGIELAAYVGHEASREVLGGRYVGCMVDSRCACAYWPHARSCIGCGECDGEDFACLDDDFPAWLRGLETYGQQAMLRAAVAAARAAHRTMHSWHPGGRAIRAAEAWLADPSEESKGRCADVAGRDLNADHQGLAVCEAIASGVDVSTLCAMEIGDAAEVAGEQAVRDAIRAALVPWALGVE